MLQEKTQLKWWQAISRIRETNMLWKFRKRGEQRSTRVRERTEELKFSWGCHFK